MGKRLAIGVATGIITFVAAGTVFAAVTCQPIFGGGESCAQNAPVSVNTMVKNPATDTFVETLSGKDPMFSPEQTVPFMIVLTNTTNSQVKTIAGKVVLPSFITYVSGVNGARVSNNTLTFTIDALNAKETKTYTLTTRVVAADKLPAGQAITCGINQATVTVNKKISQDNAQFCVQNGLVPQEAAATQETGTGQPQAQPKSQTTQQQTPGFPKTQPTSQPAAKSMPSTTKGGTQQVYPQPNVTKTPASGAESLILLGLGPLAALGFFIKKKTVLR